MGYDELVDRLATVGNSGISCNGITALLESAGFQVKCGKRGGHRIVTHKNLPNFTTFGINCGHGRNGLVKKPYVTKFLNHVVKCYEIELRLYLGDG